MRTLLIFLLLILSGPVVSQSRWSELFLSDPEMSDGFFILAQSKAAALGVETVKIDIFSTEVLPNGALNKKVVETLNLDGSHYVQLDFSLWDDLQEPFSIHYTAQGMNGAGDVVVDIQPLCVGCYGWPEVCRSTCVSTLYAYTLVAYSNGAQAEIGIQEGTVNGEYSRVYVKSSDWMEFTDLFTPRDFGIEAQYWSQVELGVQQNIPQFTSALIRLEYPDQIPPPGARDYTGLFLGPVTQSVYAVKKGKGPWQEFYETTDVISAQSVCNGQGPEHLRTVYNEDDHIEYSLDQYGLPPLSCAGMTSWGGGLSWGQGYNDWCPQVTFFPTEDVDLPGATAEVIGCLQIIDFSDPPEGNPPQGTPATLADVANIIVNHWIDDTSVPVMSIPVQGIGDPKLWPVKKKEVPGGLYDLTVILNDGQIIRRFVEFDGPTVLNADFAGFTDVTIYPVPVREDRFAVDFDLAVPTSVSITIVNNQGNTFYTKSLSFEIPGLNKHVVETGAPWPNGLYHAVFQYPDGSAESLSFTVDQ